VIAVAQLAGRLLLRHWPALLALYVGAILARYAVIELAGFVGAYSAVAGSLLFPLAILARLAALVAMLLVLRDGMRELLAIAPLPADAAARRRSFVDALLAGILPFFAFYAAWGYLREDAAAYSSRVLEVSTGLDFVAIVEERTQEGDGLAGMITLTPVTVAIMVAAFVLRWLWKRHREQLPGGLAVGALYLEVVWVYIAVDLISGVLAQVAAWVDTRQAMVWLEDLRATIASAFVPLAWVWEGVEWLLGEVGGIVLLPLAWLTIAGVVYGRAVAPEPVASALLRGEVVDRVRTGWRSLPGRVRARLADVWADIASRFTPITRTLGLMWRAGPVLIGGYILLYTVLLLLEGTAEWGLLRIIGPQDLDDFWFVNDELIFLIVPVLMEPLRIALVASAYDGVIGRLSGGQGSTTALTDTGQDSADSSSTANTPEAPSGTM
jgi:hypothetical protein